MSVGHRSRPRPRLWVVAGLPAVLVMAAGAALAADVVDPAPRVDRTGSAAVSVAGAATLADEDDDAREPALAWADPGPSTRGGPDHPGASGEVRTLGEVGALLGVDELGGVDDGDANGEIPAVSRVDGLAASDVEAVERVAVREVWRVTEEPDVVVEPEPQVAAEFVPDPAPMPEPEPQPEPEPEPGPEPESSGSVDRDTWRALAHCESTGDWSINTGNGYYGGLQFDIPSWEWAGGTRYAAMPHQASKDEQIAVAEDLLAIHPAGWGAWPACSAQLGLR